MVFLPVLASLGFPVWLRVAHYVNFLFIGLLIRSGLQILAAHPRLYWRDSSDPAKAWLKFTRREVPRDQLYTSMDDELSPSPWLTQPGGYNLGLGRLWHFFMILFWLLNGVIYVFLLFATGEWSRLLPTSWDIFPHAWQTLLTYLSLHVPPASDFRPYDPLQQLTYAAVVFLLAPFMLLTGATMSPAIEARFPWYIKLFGGRQAGRSLHFLSMLAFVAFLLIHVTLVLLVHFQNNIRAIVLGDEQGNLTLAIVLAVTALLVVALVYASTTWYSLRHKRRTQEALGTIVDPTRVALLHDAISKQRYAKNERSPYFWVNGRPPDSEEFHYLQANGFADWHLEVSGLVVNPLQLSHADLRKLPRQTQTTKHNCIQGWSGVASWTGVPVSEILRLCGPLPAARYLVFWSYQRGQLAYPHGNQEARESCFYEVIDIELAAHPQTILAYEMDDKPLPLEHGAPLRLRVETLLGYKMVKYLRAIELVSDYRTIGQGQGGFREDFQYYGRGAEI